MPLDAEIRRILDRSAGLPPLATLTVAEARERYARITAALPAPATVGTVAERIIPGLTAPQALRVYRPEAAAGAPLPILVFFHGSGFVVCSLETHDGMCRNLCAGSGFLVVSVDYRLAPEHPFPAAPDDCLSATRWISDHAAALGGDPTRMIVAGDSAGGNLAAVTTLRLRDEGGPSFIGQLLLYPVTGHYARETPSYRDNAEGFGLGRDGMRWFQPHYLPDAAHARHPHAVPLLAGDLAGLPPALIMTAEFDPLRDEGEEYGRHLAEAGVCTKVMRWDGMNHGFLQWVGRVPGADEAMGCACKWLRACADPAEC